MNKRILTEKFYGHQLQVEITQSQRTDEIKHIPEAVKAMVLSEMEHDITEGTFDYASIARYSDLSDNYCHYAGNWRFVELHYDLMLRIAMWQGNFIPEENLTRELFIEYFGESYGNHFYEKWNGEVHRDFLKMMAYFRSNRKHGQKFCNMLMRQVDRYTKRDI